jgi:hypothetical protein
MNSIKLVFKCKKCQQVFHSATNQTSLKLPRYADYCTTCLNDALFKEYQDLTRLSYQRLVPNVLERSKLLSKFILRVKKAGEEDKLVKRRENHIRMLFEKHYSGSSNYFPGTHLDYKFTNAPQDCKTALNEHLKERLENIQNDLIKEFGSVDAVEFTIRNSKVRYSFKCLECNIKTLDLKRHLMSKRHGWSKEDASTEHSYRVRTYNYHTTILRKETKKPKMCSHCLKMFVRLDTHSKTCH